MWEPTSITKRNRIVGCILGGAIGAPFEGLPVVHDCEYNGPLRITDDTQLTLAA